MIDVNLKEIILDRNTFIGLFGTMVFVILAIFGPIIIGEQGVTFQMNAYAPPSLIAPFGTDYIGHSVFNQLIYGTQRSVFVGFVAGSLTMIIGVLLGLISGFGGGLLGEVLMRITDLFISIPAIVLALILVTVLGPSDVNIIIAIGVTSWMSVARIIRADTLSMKTRLFVDAARISGGKQIYLIRRHILPNELHQIIYNMLIAVASAVVLEAGLNFLGIGNISQISWGISLYNAEQNGAIITGAWWDIFFPGLFIILFVLFVSILGMGLERNLDPRLSFKRGK